MEPAVDGRVQRGERNRAAIVAAVFALVGEGVLEPTAEQVAKRARVGLRSVFRHFRDMESLYGALDARLHAEVAPIVARGEPSGGLAGRVRELAARRARLFERVAPYKRSANLVRARSPFIDAQHRALVVQLREDLRRWLPELADRPRAVADAVELATSFEAWDRLRGDQRLSAARARGVVEAMVLALIGVG
jgi:AcrR family transcriptional regulator